MIFNGNTNLMKYLWSPWRMKYIQEHTYNKIGCTFCKLLDQDDGPNNLVLLRDENIFIVMNRFPYTSGHVMVIPKEHKPTFEDLNSQVLLDIMRFSNESMRIIRKLYNPQAFNIGANIGEAAGAGVADHVHMHVVPRWNGDTNFMSTLGHTRVLPEELEETYLRLLSEFKELARK